MEDSVIKFAGYFLGFIIIFLTIINFMSISITDTKNGGKCSRNSLSNKNNAINSTMWSQSNLPSPVYSSRSTKLNSGNNLQDQMDDYHHQFYLPPYNISS